MISDEAPKSIAMNLRHGVRSSFLIGFAFAGLASASFSVWAYGAVPLEPGKLVGVWLLLWNGLIRWNVLGSLTFGLFLAACLWLLAGLRSIGKTLVFILGSFAAAVLSFLAAVFIHVKVGIGASGGWEARPDLRLFFHRWLCRCVFAVAINALGSCSENSIASPHRAEPLLGNRRGSPSRRRRSGRFSISWSLSPTRSKGTGILDLVAACMAGRRCVSTRSSAFVRDPWFSQSWRTFPMSAASAMTCDVGDLAFVLRSFLENHAATALRHPSLHFFLQPNYSPLYPRLSSSVPDTRHAN